MSSHNFEENKSRSTCDFCGDLWPTADVICKYFSCTECGISVHKGCMQIALECKTCKIAPASPIPTASLFQRRSSTGSSTWGVAVQKHMSEMANKPITGHIMARIVQAYDLTDAMGYSVYCTVKLTPNGKDTICTGNSTVSQGNGDCTWKAAEFKNVNKSTLGLATSLFDGNSGEESKKLPPYSLELETNMFQKGMIPNIDLSLWKSTWLEALDPLFASCQISLYPLLANPIVSMERWFSLRSLDGMICGKILLNLTFIPNQEKSIPAPAPFSELSINTNGEGGKSRSRTTSEESVASGGAGSTPKASKTITNAFVSGTSTSATTIVTGPTPSPLNLKTEVPIEEVEVEGVKNIVTSVPFMNSTSIVNELTQQTSLVNDDETPTNTTATAAQGERSWVQWGSGWSSWAYEQVGAAQTAIKTIIPGETAMAVCADGPAIGKLRLHLKSAMLRGLTGQNDNSSSGNFYVRIQILNSPVEAKTHVVYQNMYQNSNPQFDKFYEFEVPHFGSGIKLSLIDHTRDKVIGTTFISIFSIIMRDADKYKSKWEVADYEDFLVTNGKTEHDKETVGTFNLRIRFQEDVHGLFTSGTPHDAQVAPEEELSVERLRIHIARFQAFISWIYLLYEEYCEVMDWKDPYFTGILFVLFLYSTLILDSEYALSAPFFLVVALHTRSLWKRKSDDYLRRWIEKDKPKKEGFRPIAYLRLAVTEYSGLSNLTFPRNELNLTGSNLTGSPSNSLKYTQDTAPHPYVKINYCTGETALTVSSEQGQTQHEDSFDMMEEDQDEFNDSSVLDMSLSMDKDNVKDKEKTDSKQNKEVQEESELLIACLPPTSSQYDRSDAAHAHLNQQQAVQGLSQLMNNTLSILSGHKSNMAFLMNFHYPWPAMRASRENLHASFSKNDMADMNLDEAQDGLIYPLLQPFRSLNASSSSATSANTDRLLPWVENGGIIKLQFHAEDPMATFSGFTGTDKRWGQVEIPISSIMTSEGEARGGLQPEVYRWFDVSLSGGATITPTAAKLNEQRDSADEEDEANPSCELKVTSTPSSVAASSHIRVKVRLQLILRQSDKEVSAEELKRSEALHTILNAKNKSTGGTLQALLGMRSNIKYVQNLMAYILNFLESFKNVLSWTVPSKTFPLYIGFITLWFAAILIPGRYLILSLGLYEFLYTFAPQPDSFPIVTRFFNLLEAVPNDDDLDKTYSEKRSQFMKNLEEEKKETVKWGRLNMIYACVWSGHVRIKGLSALAGGSTWDKRYMVLQGRRMVWWTNDEDMEVHAPTGHLLLYGHAGITQPSPVDMREVGGDGKLLAVFGMDVNGRPQRRTIICQDDDSKYSLVWEINKVLGIEVEESQKKKSGRSKKVRSKDKNV